MKFQLYPPKVGFCCLKWQVVVRWCAPFIVRVQLKNIRSLVINRGLRCRLQQYFRHLHTSLHLSPYFQWKVSLKVSSTLDCWGIKLWPVTYFKENKDIYSFTGKDDQASLIEARRLFIVKRCKLNHPCNQLVT